MSELDPRTAAEHARAMGQYVHSFDGQKFDSVFDSVDRRNLATALDNLEETSAMLLNTAARLATDPAKFKRGDLVRKTKGSQWHGTVVGEYSTELTPEGYAVESFTEKGSVQIYPAAALEFWSGNE